VVEVPVLVPDDVDHAKQECCGIQAREQEDDALIVGKRVDGTVRFKRLRPIGVGKTVPDFSHSFSD
jgi:hypothetical protein